ncbi:hypothetical protein LFM09_20450 [Lentzea alba]|uniref:hypothetical protein n=1 Tax=Lentzea alba TaxID=2714351 RepID=UPI0039BED085
MRALIAFLSAAAILLVTSAPASAAPVPVQLIAETGLAKVIPTPIEIHMEAFARNANTGANLNNVLVSFRTTTGNVLCTDHTDSGGKASCDAEVDQTQLVLVLLLGFDAVVTGTADYGPATAHNSVRIV